MKQGPAGGVPCGVLALVFTVAICQGIITSFSVSHGSNWRCSLMNSDVVLICDVDDDDSTIAIKRLKDGAIVNVSPVGEKSLTYVIYAVSCSDVGTYECLLDNTERMTADLVIAECPPQSCDGSQVNRTMFVRVGDPVQFLFCVLACYSIAPDAEFNGSKVRRKSHSVWTWDYEPIISTGHTTRFMVLVTCNLTDTEAYGLSHVRIFSYLGKLYYSDFHIMLQPPGPPHCPTYINVTNYGHNYVILSWKPGLDGGSRQNFYVYYSKDKVTWDIFGGTVEETTENVSGLSSLTTYYFRVASRNQHSASVNAGSCTRTVFVVTKSLIKPVELHEVPERSDILVSTLTLGDCLLLVGMLLMSALFCWRRKVNREHRRRDVIQGQVEIPMVASQTGSITTPGEYMTIVETGSCSQSTSQ